MAALPANEMTMALDAMLREIKADFPLVGSDEQGALLDKLAVLQQEVKAARRAQERSKPQASTTARDATEALTAGSALPAHLLTDPEQAVAATMEADLEAIASDLASLSDLISVTLRSAGQPDTELEAQPDDDVMGTVAAAVGFEPRDVLMGDQSVAQGSFAENGVEAPVLPHTPYE